LQCKQYANPVGSGHVQKVNGTARPHHGADLPIMIALNGFSALWQTGSVRAATGDHLDGGSGAVAGMRERAPW
jgi:hypothetical protein